MDQKQDVSCLESWPGLCEWDEMLVNNLSGSPFQIPPKMGRRGAAPTQCVHDPRNTEIVGILKVRPVTWHDLFNSAGHSSAMKHLLCTLTCYQHVFKSHLGHKWMDFRVHVDILLAFAQLSVST